MTSTLVQLHVRPLPHAAQQARRLVAEAGHGWARPHPASRFRMPSALWQNAIHGEFRDHQE